MTRKWLAEIDATLTELLQVVSSFDDEHINVIPFEGSWTAGQVAQHLVMSNSGFVHIINGPVKDSVKAPDELVEQIRTDFLNFGIKMSSPDFVQPRQTSYEKKALLQSLEKIRADLMKAIATLDLTKTCLSFELPFYGFLTRLEALSFILYHTQRHIRQLKNIRNEVAIHTIQNQKKISI